MTAEAATGAGRRPRLNIIGCGRAAGSLARLWLEAGALGIGDVLNRSPGSAAGAVRGLGAGRAVSGLGDMAPADLWLIGTGDDRIAEVAAALAEHVRQAPDPGALLVFHLAGRLGTEVLAPLAALGVQVAALHPVRSLTHDALGIEAFRGTACVAEGDAAGLRRLQPLVEAVGGFWVPVQAVDRGLYHAALSIVSNVTKGVAWKAQTWLERSGLEPSTAASVTHQLLQSTMDDLFRAGARQSITGPVVRGDTRTVEAHLAALEASYPRDVELYRVLARTVLELAEERGDLDAKVLARFQALLGGCANSG